MWLTRRVTSEARPSDPTVLPSISGRYRAEWSAIGGVLLLVLLGYLHYLGSVWMDFGRQFANKLIATVGTPQSSPTKTFAASESIAKIQQSNRVEE
jgi:hypothetical protein